MNPIATDEHVFNLRDYPTAQAIITQAAEHDDHGDRCIPDTVLMCADALAARGAGQARFCVLGREGDSALFELNGYYLSVLACGEILDGDDVLQEALAAPAFSIADDDDEGDQGDQGDAGDGVGGTSPWEQGAQGVLFDTWISVSDNVS